MRRHTLDVETLRTVTDWLDASLSDEEITRFLRKIRDDRAVGSNQYWTRLEVPGEPGEPLLIHNMIAFQLALRLCNHSWSAAVTMLPGFGR